jgi:integrase
VERKGKRIKKHPVVVGLHADFLDWLARRPITNDDPQAFLFPALANRSGAGRNGLSKAFERIMNKAGINSPVIKTGSGKKGRSIRALSFHSFRHGAASAVFNSQAIKEMQRRVTQHSAKSGVLERYTHADLDLVHQAVAAIPRLPKRPHRMNYPSRVCQRCGGKLVTPAELGATDGMECDDTLICKECGWAFE